MSYVGNAPAVAYTNTVKDTFSGDNSTVAFTLSVPSTTNNVRVVVENVIQDPTVAYSVSGTTLTFTSAPPSGTNNIYVVHLGPAVQTVQPPTDLSGNFTLTGDFAMSGNLTVDTNTLFVDAASNNVGIGTSSPSALAHVYNGTLQVGSKTGDTSIQQNTNAIRIAAVPNSTTEWGGLQWYREFSDYIGAEIIAARPGAAEALTDLIFKTSGSSADASERMRIDSSGNVGIGTSSPSSFNGGANNLVVGSGSGSEGITIYADNASNSAIFFADTDSTTTGQLNYLHASNAMTFHTNGGNERMRIDASGNLFVGTTAANPNPGAAIFPAGSMSLGNSAGSSGFEFLTFRRSGVQIGSITQSGTTGVAYNNSSDYRLKEDVQPMVGASDRLMALKPVNFAWKADGSRVDGFLAHEAQEVVPEAVTGEKDAVDDDGNPQYQGIDQSKLVPLLTAALQEALTKIEALEARMAVLEGGAA